MACTIDWHGWTRWRRLSNLDLDSVPDSPGVYAISASRPITRAIGADRFGILDIGESASLRYRLEKFRECAAHRGTEGHMAGWRYAFFHLDAHFPLSTLRVRYRATNTKQQALKEEGKLLRAYLERHSELPPLNYQFNWHDFDELA